MNRVHGLICSSGWWARTVEQRLLPWALAGVELEGDVLEIGPGFGATTRVLARRTDALTVLELQPSYCARLRRELGTQVEVVEGDATAMPFADARFGTVVCFTMLHHVPSPAQQDRMLAEVTRVLRPGGMFAGSDSVGTGRFFRLLHVGDTLVPLPVEGVTSRLEHAGLRDPQVSIGGNSFRFRASKPEPAAA
jgi:ubiquinone/menaquinone biosynthesis C-methylase UbiE